MKQAITRHFKVINSTNGLQSKGRVTKNRYDPNHYEVKFGREGKLWKTEKDMKLHILKVMTMTKTWPDEWEIVEVTYAPTKPVSEWVDPEMMIKIMKNY